MVLEGCSAFEYLDKLDDKGWGDLYQQSEEAEALLTMICCLLISHLYVEGPPSRFSISDSNLMILAVSFANVRD